MGPCATIRADMHMQSNLVVEEQPSSSELLQLPARICLVAGVIMVHEGKILLINHRKLDIWLGPGGHVEPNEPPHVTAMRECFEETGITCELIDPYFPMSQTTTQFVPSPIHSQIHWVCQENYQRRMNNPDSYQPVEVWKHGCEQHLGFSYLGRPVGTVKLKRDLKETIDCGWFTQKEAIQLPTTDTIKQEFNHVFLLIKNKRVLL